MHDADCSEHGGCRGGGSYMSRGADRESENHFPVT